MAAPSFKKDALKLGIQSLRAVEEPGKAAEFFREICRCLPYVLKQYKLDELTSVPELRSNIALLFRKNEKVTSPDVVNLLIFKGREELETIMLNHKQRHHLVTGYVHNPALDRVKKPSTASPFLEAFYKGN